ncbi:MAG: VCBS repeat-containing protein [Planctomycetaceae bacterium]
MPSFAVLRSVRQTPTRAGRLRRPSLLLVPLFVSLAAPLAAQTSAPSDEQPEVGWKVHAIMEGEGCVTAVAADYNKDGQMDVIADIGKGETILFTGPNWERTLLDDDHRERYIHSETWDVDGDGDPDYIGAAYNPGLIMWYECPEQPTSQKWTRRLVDNQIHGIHGVIRGDVDRDGRIDLLATSAQPLDPFPNSLAWLSPPGNVHSDEPWSRHIFAVGDAPGLTHYMGFGDINGDGRPDAATGAKGGPQDTTGKGEWFAWWEAPADPRQPWVRRDLPGPHPGATNIHPADINGDGRTDLLASRGHGQGVIWFEAPDWKVHVIDAELTEPHCLQVTDIDKDGDQDAVTCAYGSQLCVWYENDGKGTFRRHVVGNHQEAYDIRVADMDSDGDMDFLVAGRGSNNVVWYENPARKPTR